MLVVLGPFPVRGFGYLGQDAGADVMFVVHP